MSPITHLPGTVRLLTDERGRTTTTEWGSLDEQICEATTANARQLAAGPHVTTQLYSFAGDCGHTDPEVDSKYDGVEDLIADWLQRNCLIGPDFTNRRPGDDRDYWARIDLNARNTSRAYAAIPLASEWKRAQEAYDGSHSHVCLVSPMGTACLGCLSDEGIDPDDSDGINPFACRRAEAARERRDAFWHLFTAEALEARHGC